LGAVSITVGAMSSAKPGSTGFSPRKPGETTVQYQQRLAKERAARTRTATAPQSPGAAPQAGVYLDADERTNRILMIGLAEQLDEVDDLIDALDVEQTILRTMKLYRIEHVDAEQAQKKLQELQIISGSGLSSSSSSSRITGQTRVGSATKPAAGTRGGSPSSVASRGTGDAVGGLVEEPLVVVIEATNSLLVNATPEQHTQIELALKYVDAQTDETTIPYVIYPLENQKPEDLATILEKLIQETVKDKEGKIEQVIKKTEEEIVIVPDENTFSIIVYASKKNQEWISNLIETLDKRRPQVLIDVTLVEVWKTEEFTYNLNLIESFPNFVDLAGVSATGGFTGAMSGKTSTDIMTSLADAGRDRFLDFQVDSGSGTGFYADKHIHALLKLVQAQNYGRILAKPKVLVNDNETGNISTKKTTYVKTTSSIPVAAGGAGNQSQLVQTAVDYQPYDSGIQLDITPHISEGDLLRLEIALTRSDFLETAASGGETDSTEAKPPDTVSSDITTIVTVPDGSTIILGGMTKLDQTKGGSKVPLLGDLPLIGALFRNAGNKGRQEKLYIFVKAEIIRPAETLTQGLPDLEKLSERNRMAFEKFEQEFQTYKNFPGIKAKPVAPLKVLETE